MFKKYDGFWYNGEHSRSTRKYERIQKEILNFVSTSDQLEENFQNLQKLLHRIMILKFKKIIIYLIQCFI